MERCAALGVPDAAFPQVLARVPEYAKALLRALVVSHAEGNVDHKLKEVIRVQLAHTAGDAYFAGLRSRKALDEGLTEETIAAGRRNSRPIRDSPRRKNGLSPTRASCISIRKKWTPLSTPRASGTTPKRRSWSWGRSSRSIMGCRRLRARSRCTKGVIPDRTRNSCRRARVRAGCRRRSSAEPPRAKGRVEFMLYSQPASLDLNLRGKRHPDLVEAIP